MEKVKNHWPLVIDAVKAQRIHLGSFLNEGHPTALSNGVLEISFGKDNGFHVKNIVQNKKLIQSILLDQTGFALRIECKQNKSKVVRDLIDENKAAAPESISDQESDEDEILQIPIVKKVIEVFGGELVKQ